MFRRAIESAGASFQATVADYDNAPVSLTADVANSYILIRTLEKRLGIARENVETQKESLKIAKARFGTDGRNGCGSGQNGVNNTLASIPALETQLQQAKHALCLLLGLPPSNLADVLAGASEIPVSPPQVVVGIPMTCSAAARIFAAPSFRPRPNAPKSAWPKRILPGFFAQRKFWFSRDGCGKFPPDRHVSVGKPNYQVGPSFQWNLFNYGRITNNVRVQDARFEQLLIAYQNAVLKGQQEVEDALVAFLRAEDRAGFWPRPRRLPRSLDLAVLQYREGIKDFTTVLVAQQALLNEQDNLAAALGSIPVIWLESTGPWEAAGRYGKERTWCPRSQGGHGKTHQLGPFACPVIL